MKSFDLKTVFWLLIRQFSNINILCHSNLCIHGVKYILYLKSKQTNKYQFISPKNNILKKVFSFSRFYPFPFEILFVNISLPKWEDHWCLHNIHYIAYGTEMEAMCVSDAVTHNNSLRRIKIFISLKGSESFCALCTL